MSAKELFLEALEKQSVEDRQRYLDEACGADLQLRRRVEALLAAHDDPESYLDRPAARFDVTATQDGVNSGSGLSDSSSHHGRFLPGTKLADRYRIVSLLGRGGMGEVYRADDLRLGQTVALKFLPSELAKDPKRLEYFHNEVRLARQISHPNVCRVYDIGEVDGQLFISMEYIDGEDLKALIHRIGRLPTDKGVQIAQQLCAGLAAAHSKGVLHRDLKPANIMIDGQGQVRITDFGLATFSADGEDIVGLSGTPAYMAPEQLLRAKTNVQTDIYSLGLVLYEVFTGRNVHREGSLADLKRWHQESSTPSDPGDVIEDLDPAIRSGLMRCLRADPAERPASVDELAMWMPGGDALAAALAAGEVPSPDMVAAAGRTSPYKPVMSYAALIAIFAGLGISFLLSSRVPRRDTREPEYSPPVLRNKAIELLSTFGYDMNPIDEAQGIRSPEFLKGPLSAREVDGKTDEPDSIRYWVRFSPEPLRSLTPIEGQGRVTRTQPAWDVAGMSGMELDLDGKLRWFRSVSQMGAEGDGQATTESWSRWFDAETVGVDLTQLSQVEPRELPPDPYDALAAWEGETSELGPLRILAAAFNGKPTFFSFEPLREESEQKRAPALAIAISQLSICILALVLAYRNLRLSRGDWKGAWSFAILVFWLELLAWSFGTHWTSSDHIVTVAWFALGESLRQGFFAAVMYLAVEPMIRRVWPSALTTLTRLLRGSWSDARVAQDVLMGISAGAVTTALCTWIFYMTNTYSGMGVLEGAFFGGRFLVSDMMTMVRFSLMTAIGALVALVLLQWVVRSRLAAIVCWIAVFTPLLGVVTGCSPEYWVLRGSVPLLLTALLYARHGVVGVAAYQLSLLLFDSLSLRVSSTYFQNGLLYTAVGVALALLAFRLSLKEPRVNIWRQST